jgi:Uma2 family endonuclease
VVCPDSTTSLMLTKSLTLEKFLQLPETKPASEFINGEIIQKSMPQGEHSRLQSKLCSVINQVTETAKIAYAFSELRCTFGSKSIVPDISIFRWSEIPRLANGRIANRFEINPNWAIEILSPNQSQTKVLGNLLHCAEFGSELGWLIYPEEASVLAVLPGAKVKLLQGDDSLPVIDGIDLKLKVKEIFQWLII